MVARNDQRPDPDPTRLTTDAILREVEHSEELRQAERRGDRELYDSKIAGIERGIDKAFSAETVVTQALDERMRKMDNRLTIMETGGRVTQDVKGERFSSSTTIAAIIIAGLSLLLGVGSLLYNFWRPH